MPERYFGTENDRRLIEVEVRLGRHDERLSKLENEGERERRILDTLHESIHTIAFRTGSLERWRERDEPKVEAATKADEIAAELAKKFGQTDRRKLARGHFWLAVGAVCISLVAVIVNIATSLN